jgi:hypothetical protein
MEDNNTNVETNVETNQNTNTNEDSNNSSQSTIDYAKLEEMITKGIQTKENGILKSYFEKQGLEESEIQEAIKSYKENKAKSQPNFDELSKEIESLKSQNRQNAIDYAMQLEANKLGIDEKQLPYIAKLMDLSKVNVENGKVDSKAINEQFNNLFEVMPQLKPQKTQKSNGSFKFGSDNNQQQKGKSEEELMREAIGLKPKK